MIGWIISKFKLRPDFSVGAGYVDCISDLIDHPAVRAMKNYIQHNAVDCLQHSLYVSYNSYFVCRKMNLDYRSAARGGLLHDFFLYDWHVKKPCEGLHGFSHPRAALRNANKYFYLNALEQDIIVKHMWPLTITPPKYKEAYIVSAIDKYCAFMEICNCGGKAVRRLQSLLCC